MMIYSYLRRGILLLGTLLVSVSTLAQGYQVEPARYAEVIAGFEAEQDLPEKPVLFIGSSSIRFWDTLQEDMAPLTVVNRGFGGSNMRDAVHYFERVVKPLDPRAVVLYEGDNDLSAHGANPANVMVQFTEFVNKLNQHLPNTRLYVMSIKPSIARMDSWDSMKTTNVLLHNRCHAMKHCQYIDVSSAMFNRRGQLREEIFVEDGIHMNAQGYDIWQAIVRPALLEKELPYELAYNLR